MKPSRKRKRQCSVSGRALAGLSGVRVLASHRDLRAPSRPPRSRRGNEAHSPARLRKVWVRVSRLRSANRSGVRNTELLMAFSQMKLNSVRFSLIKAEKSCLVMHVLRSRHSALPMSSEPETRNVELGTWNLPKKSGQFSFFGLQTVESALEHPRTPMNTYER